MTLSIPSQDRERDIAQLKLREHQNSGEDDAKRIAMTSGAADNHTAAMNENNKDLPDAAGSIVYEVTGSLN